MSEYERYSRKDLDKDLHLMVRAGLLDISIREDGEWMFSVTEEAFKLTEDELRERLDNLESLDYE